MMPGYLDRGIRTHETAIERSQIRYGWLDFWLDRYDILCLRCRSVQWDVAGRDKYQQPDPLAIVSISSFGFKTAYRPEPIKRAHSLQLAAGSSIDSDKK